MVGSNTFAEDFESIFNSFDILLEVFKQLNCFINLLPLRYILILVKFVIDVHVFLPNSSHSLRVTGGQANNLGDVHPADGSSAPLVLVEAQESTLQRAPTAGHL